MMHDMYYDDEPASGMTLSMPWRYFGRVPQRPWGGASGGIPHHTSFTRNESPLTVSRFPSGGWPADRCLYRPFGGVL